MVGTLHGPWLICAALLLAGVAVVRGPRPLRCELWLVVAIVIAGAAARLGLGVWGPLHNNGQGPLWIRGALEPSALAGYGPGYFELFTWVAELSASPALGASLPVDRALFAANAVLSAISPALLYAAARLAGVGRGGALAVALILAADPVSVRTAASEGYFTAQVALVLAVETSLALAAAADRRRDALGFAAALAAAGLLAATAARIHPMAYLPLAVTPLVMLGAAQGPWRTRLALTLAAGAAIGAAVLFTSGNTIAAVLGTSEMSRSVVSGVAPHHALLAAALLAAAVGLHRCACPPWLPVLAAGAAAAMLATQDRFQQHPIWTLCYQRLFFPGLLLGASALLPARLQRPAWSVAAAAAVVAAFAVQAERHLWTPNTEQLEYRFLQQALGDMPPECLLTAVSRTGNRVWEIPGHLLPRRPGQRTGARRAIEQASDLRAIRGGGCVLYIHSSLCSSAEGRPVCEAVERDVQLEPVARRVFPAEPSFVWLPYDRPEVEVAIHRVVAGPAIAHGEGAGADVDPVAIGDGAAITPAAAQALYERLAPLRAADGCRMLRFDTSRFRIAVTLQSPAGAVRALELAAGAGGPTTGAGDWTLAVPADLRRDCGATVAAIERAVADEPDER